MGQSIAVEKESPIGRSSFRLTTYQKQQMENEWAMFMEITVAGINAGLPDNDFGWENLANVATPSFFQPSHG